MKFKSKETENLTPNFETGLMGEESNVVTGFSNKQGLSKDDLIMEAWSDCRKKRSEELRRGFYNTKFDNLGNAWEVWNPDSREIYLNAVRAFEIILTADLDDEYKEAIKPLMQEGKDSFNKYGWKEFKKVKIASNSKDAYGNPISYIYKKEFTGERIMPEQTPRGKGCIVYDMDSDGKSVALNWDNNYHQYMQNLVLIYDEFFEQIVLLLKRIKYFKKETRFG